MSNMRLSSVVFDRPVTPPSGSPLFFLNDMSVRKVDEESLAVTVVNTAAETVLMSVVLPALTLTEQGGGRWSMAGAISNSAVAAGTVRFRAKVVISGTTTTFATSTAISCSTSNNARTWQMGGMILGSTIPTSLRVWSGLDVTNPSTSTVKTTQYSGRGEQALTVGNSSTATTIKVTAQMSAANANFSVVARSMTAEALQ